MQGQGDLNLDILFVHILGIGNHFTTVRPSDSVVHTLSFLGLSYFIPLSVSGEAKPVRPDAERGQRRHVRRPEGLVRVRLPTH